MYATLAPVLVRFKYTWPSMHNTSSKKTDLPEEVANCLLQVGLLNIKGKPMSEKALRKGIAAKFSQTRIPKKVRPFTTFSTITLSCHPPASLFFAHSSKMPLPLLNQTSPTRMAPRSPAVRRLRATRLPLQPLHSQTPATQRMPATTTEATTSCTRLTRTSLKHAHLRLWPPSPHLATDSQPGKETAYYIRSLGASPRLLTSEKTLLHVACRSPSSHLPSTTFSPLLYVPKPYLHYTYTSLTHY